MVEYDETCVSDKLINVLRAEAEAARDLETVEYCNIALIRDDDMQYVGVRGPQGGFHNDLNGLITPIAARVIVANQINYNNGH